MLRSHHLKHVHAYQGTTSLSFLNLPFVSYLILSGIFALTQMIMDLMSTWVTSSPPILKFGPFCISLCTLVFCAIPSYKHAYKAFIQKRFIIEHAILLSIMIAFAHGTWQLYAHIDAPSFFNIIVYSIFLMHIRRYFSHFEAHQSPSSQQLLNRFIPSTATLLDAEKTRISVKNIKPGQKLIISTSERIPADGVILSGECVIDESVLTTHSSPVPKFINDIVKCGTLNVEGTIIIQVLKPFPLSVMGKTIELLEQSKAYQTTIDTNLSFVPWFFITSSIIALTTFFWWLPQNISQAYYSLISIVLLSSPVVLGLVIPITYTLSLFLLHRRGIRVQNLKALELLSNVQYLFFYSSEPLTKRKVKVKHIEYVNTQPEDQKAILEKIAAIESQSAHPHSQAISEYLVEQNIEWTHVDIHYLRLFPNRGLRGFINKEQVLVGTARWLKNNGVAISLEELDQTQTNPHAIPVIYCAINGVESARIYFHYAQQVTVLPFLQTLNQELAVSAFCENFDANVNKVLNKPYQHCHLIETTNPKEKALHIANLQAKGHLVAMVGHDVDDVPALIQSDIAIVGSHSPYILRGCADIILPKNDVSQIIHCLKFSKLLIDIFKQNATLCFSFYLALVPFAAMGNLSAEKLALGSFGLISMMSINAFRLLKGNLKNKDAFSEKQRWVEFKTEKLPSSHAAS